MNVPLLAAGLLATFGFIGLLASGLGRDTRPPLVEFEPGPAAPFTLVDLDGKRWSLADLRGRHVVLNFWATWCQECKVEHETLVQAQRDRPGVQFLGVVFSDDPARVRPYLERVGTSYPHLLDPDGVASIAYGVTGVPETFFIDDSGAVVHKQVGPVNEGVIAAVLGLAR